MQSVFSNQSSWKHGTLRLRAGSGFDLQTVSALDLHPVFRHFATKQTAVKAPKHTPRGGQGGYAFLGEWAACHALSSVVFQLNGNQTAPHMQSSLCKQSRWENATPSCVLAPVKVSNQFRVWISNQFFTISRSKSHGLGRRRFPNRIVTHVKQTTQAAT